MLFNKYFTPLEAKKTLPLVKQIVRDIINSANDIKMFNFKDEKNLSENPVVAEHLERINRYVEELEELGCYYKDWNFEIGLVDFPAFIENEDVMLCWKSDEDDIKFYHNHTDGFAGRKPIPEKYFVGEVVI